MENRSLGIDLAKVVFQLHGEDESGSVVLQKRVTRSKVGEAVAKFGPCRIGFEAGAGAHHWARKFQAQGHEVKMMAPQFVKPFVKANKNDANDAEAICEAMNRPNMRFISVKSVEQQQMQAALRVRQRLIEQRTALVNEIRGILAEFGIVFGKERRTLKRELPKLLATRPGEMQDFGWAIVQRLHSELLRFEDEVGFYDEQIETLRRQNPLCKKLQTIPGIGPLTAFALAACTHPKDFKSGRQFSAFLGLVPGQHSSGGKTNLLGISKRGNSYLRTLLIHGARTMIRWCENKQDRTSVWVKKLCERRGYNKAAVALARKQAIVAWVLATREDQYRAFAG